MTFTVAFLVQS